MLLVDVREPNEIAVERYPDAVVVPLSSFDPAAIPDPQGKQVVFACRSGRRSVTASLAAQETGLSLYVASGGRHPGLEGCGPADRKLTARQSLSMLSLRRSPDNSSLPRRRCSCRRILERTAMRRALSVLALIAVAAALAAAPSAAQQKGQKGQRVLNVYNWSDYVDPAVLEEFTKSTGIKVRYDTFDTNDMLEAKLLAGRSGYDVVAPTGYFLERQIKAKIFQPLDKSKLPNLVHLWPEVSQRLAKYDPGNVIAVNYMWGTTGIGYNVAKAREVLGRERQDRQLGHRLQAGESRDVQGLRHPHAGFRRRHPAGGAALSRPRSEFDAGSRAAEGRRPGDDDPARWCASFTRPNISTRSPPAKSASRSDSRATSSRRRSAPRRRRTASRSPMRSRTRARSSGSTISRSRATPRNVAEAHEFINFLQTPEIAAPQLEFHLLRQRQSREPEIHRQGSSGRPDRSIRTRR